MLRNNLAKICIFISIFLILILNSSGNIESIDGLASLNMARNFVYHGTWNVASPTYNIGMGVYKVDGKYYSAASKGYAVAMVPVVWVTKIIYERNGFTPIANFPLESDYLLTFLASFVNPVLAFVLLVIVYKLLKFISKNDGVSLLLALVMTLTTNLLPLAKDSFVHILFTLMVVVALYCMVRFFNNKKQFWWMVILVIDFGLLKYSYNTSFALPVLGLYLFGLLILMEEWVKLERSIYIRNVVISTVLTMGLFIVGSRLVGFDLTNIRGVFVGEGTRRNFFQGFWGQMFSPGKSLFVYSPVLVLSLYWAIRNLKNIYSKLFLIMLGLYVGFYSMFDIWHGELSYGPRYLSVLIPFGVVVLAVNWKKINKWILGLLIVVGLYVQLVGVVIPYQVQYPDFDLLSVSFTDVKNREGIFEYYSIGEFIPRFSPPYGLKRVLITRLMSLKDIFKTVPEPVAILAGNVMVPDKNDNGRSVESNFYLMANKDLKFNSVDVETDKKYKSLTLCDKNGCQKNKYSFNLKKGDFLKINFGTNEKYIIKKLTLGSEDVDLNNYYLVKSDRFMVRGTMLDYEKSVSELEKDWWYTGMVNNLSPDFWWVKTQIYQNLPPIFRNSFYIIVGLFGFCLLVIGGNQIHELFFKIVKTKK